MAIATRAIGGHSISRIATKMLSASVETTNLRRIVFCASVNSLPILSNVTKAHLSFVHLLPAWRWTMRPVVDLSSRAPVESEKASEAWLWRLIWAPRRALLREEAVSCATFAVAPCLPSVSTPRHHEITKRQLKPAEQPRDRGDRFDAATAFLKPFEDSRVSLFGPLTASAYCLHTATGLRMKTALLKARLERRRRSCLGDAATFCTTRKAPSHDVLTHQLHYCANTVRKGIRVECLR
jgi:hypothetical protein